MPRFVAFALLLVLCPNLIAADLHPVDVFPAGMNGVTLYRIPGMVVTKQGTLLAYCEARHNSAADWGEIEVHLRRSLDRGDSWLPAVKIAHEGVRLEGNPAKSKGGEHEQTVNNPVAMVIPSSGRIVMLYCINYARCFQIQSDDDGQSWTKPVEITAAFEPFRKQHNWRVIATGPGHGIMLRTGRLVVPVWLAYGKPGAHHPSFAATIYSDDGGQSWNAGEVAVDNHEPYGDPNESIAATLANGHVLLMSRNVSATNRKLLTTSGDGATGWSKPEFHPQLREPICMSSLISVPKIPGTLIYSGPDTEAVDDAGKPKPRAGGPRKNLTIKISRDDGESWSAGQTVAPGASAYSDLAIFDDGTLICLYEGDRTIRCVTLPKSWWDQ